MNDATMKTTYFYRLHFFVPVEGRTDYYFSSLPCMYGRFSEDALGVTWQTIKNSAPKPGNPRITRKCAIYREEMYRNSK